MKSIYIKQKKNNCSHLFITCVCAQFPHHVQLFLACSIACQALLSTEFSRQEYWSGLPCPSPGDLPDPGIEHVFPVSPELAGGFFTTEPPGKPR